MATIYEDPNVKKNTKTIYRTHTHQLWVVGSGFTKAPQYSTSITLDPPLTAGDDYSLVVYNRTHMLLSLFEGAWPSRLIPTPNLSLSSHPSPLTPHPSPCTSRFVSRQELEDGVRGQAEDHQDEHWCWRLHPEKRHPDRNGQER